MPNTSDGPILFSILLLLLTANHAFITKKTVPPHAGKPRKARRISTRLTHRDSVLPVPYHYFKPDSTPEDSISRLSQISSARFLYLRETVERELGISDFQVDVQRTYLTSMFFVNFSIGEPPVPQFTIMDTGSSLLWIQCVPCKNCSRQTSPMLDPSMSSTFSIYPCSDPICRYAPNAGCSLSSECAYKQIYINGAGSKGVMAKDRIIFESSGYGRIVLNDIAFGCGHENGEHGDRMFTGVFGLGTKHTSIAVQLGSKFSYCIGDISDRDYGYNKLVLGEDADILGYSTPIETSAGIYYMTLEGISIGEKRLDIDPQTFRRRGPKSGVIIDSGTVFTWLAEDAYNALFDEIKALLDPSMMRYWYKNYLCYNGKVKEDLSGFPVVTFHFTGGADLELEAESTFYQVPETEPYGEVFCMAMRPTTEHGREYKDFTAIGLMAQQYYNVAYDLKGRTMYFQRIDCQLLDDYDL